MGKAIKILITILLIMLLTPNVCAKQEGIDEFLNIIPDDIEIKSEQSLIELIKIDKLFSYLTASFKNVLKSCASVVVSLCIIVILLSVFSNFEKNKELNKTIDSAAVVVAAALIFNAVIKCIDVCSANIESSSVFCKSCIPIVLSLCVASGNTFSAAVFSTTISFLTSISQTISQYIFIPVIIVMFCLSLLQNTDFSFDFLAIANQLKKFIKWGIGIFISIFSISVSFQTFLSASQDSFVKRSIKSAVGTFVPVIGSSLSAGLDSVFAIAANTKNTIAICGAIVVLLIFLNGIINTFVYGFGISVVKIFASTLGVKNFCKSLAVVADTFYLMCAVVSCCAIMTIVCFFVVCINII